MAAPRRLSSTDLALIAVFAALIAAFALTPAIPLGSVGVPLTLQTLAVALTGLVLGSWRGFLATLLYVVVGLAGIPVLAGGKAGIGVLFGPTAGYLVSFPLAAALTGAIAGYCLHRQLRPRLLWLSLASLSGALLVTTPLGILGMMLNAGLSFPAALAAAAPYLPGDVVKMIAAAAIALAVHKAFPALLIAGRVPAARQ